MYNTVGKKFFCAHIANNVYHTVSNCEACAINCKRNRLQRHLQLFPPTQRFQSISMNILSSLSQAMNRSLFFKAITNRYSIMAIAILTSKRMATDVANMFLHYWVVPCGTPTDVLADNGRQFLSKFFAILCRLLELEHLTTAAYRSWTGVHVE